MKRKTSPAIILRRINYGEADRIITFLTPVGKVSAMVKGVRRSKSKLAGGIELFSESMITFLESRGELHRIIDTRLEVHWGGIVGNIQRMMFGYEAMKTLDRIIDNDADSSYYNLLKMSLEGLSDPSIPLVCVEVWFYGRLLSLTGHAINLKTDASGKSLKEDSLYDFYDEEMCFIEKPMGAFRADHIKLLRLSQLHKPILMKQIKGSEFLCESLVGLLKGRASAHL